METIERSVIEDAVAINPSATLYENYSGRGMYGEKCFGVVVPNIQEAMIFAASYGATGDNWDQLFGAAQTDDMGRQIIVYFPGYQLSED